MKTIKLHDNWLDVDHHSYTNLTVLDDGAAILMDVQKYGKYYENSSCIVLQPEQVEELKKALA